MPPILSPTRYSLLSFRHPCSINEALWLCPSPSEPGGSFQPTRPSERERTPLTGIHYQRLLTHMTGRNTSSFTPFPWVLILLPGLWKRLVPPLCPLYLCQGSALLLAGAPARQGFEMLWSPQSYRQLCIVVAICVHHAHQWTLQCPLLSSAHISGGKDVGKMLRGRKPRDP